jgi:DNA gyrase subunit A
MARKKKTAPVEEIVYAPVTEQLITDSVEKNYMPYAMMAIRSRAIPEIDGFKPSHRKLLYTMFKMGLLTGQRTKSSNVVGQTMKLNPHGDMSIYETMVRLTRSNESLLHPFVDSKGSFGKQYSSNMKFAAPRYTEVKLDEFSSQIFEGIDKNAVDLVDNYDGTLTEPTLLPTTFPNILVNANLGIAVGMASNICSFNLAEVCDGTIAVLKKPKTTTERLMEIIKAPDFPCGGTIIYNEAAMKKIYETGKGSFPIRAKYHYDKENNSIIITEIPYSTTIEAIMKALDTLTDKGKLKDVTDYRDEIDITGFKLAIDLRKGVDPDDLMTRLYKLTPLEDSFSCNFNILIDLVPMQLGVRGIIDEWIKFRLSCVVRMLTFDLAKMNEKLHLLKGLGKILLDIDKAIRIIRNTKAEADVVPNLMEGFSIDEVQANYIAEIKLRHLNREYIMNKIKEIEELQKKIAETEEILADELKQKQLIIDELTVIKKKYGKPRRSEIVNQSEVKVFNEKNFVEQYNARFVLTRDGYFKKITFASLRGNDEQMLKDGDVIVSMFDSDNNAELIFFTNMGQIYRVRAADFGVCKASVMGEYLPSVLKMESGEKPVCMMDVREYPEDDYFVYFFANGKGVRIPMSAYETKGARKKLTGAFYAESPTVGIFRQRGKDDESKDVILVSSDNKAIVLPFSAVEIKSTKKSRGTQLFTLKKGATLTAASENVTAYVESTKGYKKYKFPAAGTAIGK